MCTRRSQQLGKLWQCTLPGGVGAEVWQRSWRQPTALHWLHSLSPSAVLVQAHRWCPSCLAGAIAASPMQACDVLRAAMPWCWPRTGTRLTLR